MLVTSIPFPTKFSTLCKVIFNFPSIILLPANVINLGLSVILLFGKDISFKKKHTNMKDITETASINVRKRLRE